MFVCDIAVKTRAQRTDTANRKAEFKRIAGAGRRRETFVLAWTASLSGDASRCAPSVSNAAIPAGAIDSTRVGRR